MVVLTNKNNNIMSRILTYVVTLTFEDKIVSDDEVNEVGVNIANALEHEANTRGLAPEESETFTKSITVSKDGIEIITNNIV